MSKIDKLYCGFCEMPVQPSVDGKRLERYEKPEFISYDHIRMNTPIDGASNKTIIAEAYEGRKTVLFQYHDNDEKGIQ